MKKSEIVNRTILPMLAEDTGLSEVDIKIALTAQAPKIETSSIKSIKSLAQAKKLYNQAKSHERQNLIVLEALNLCQSFDDFDTWISIMGWDVVSARPAINGEYSIRIRSFVKKSIEEAQTFEQVHSIWVRLNHDDLAVEDRMAHAKMCQLALSTSTVEVIKILYGDGGMDFLAEDSHQYEVFMVVCKNASPETALDALQWFKEYSWDGEQDTYPVQLLIQKAAELYRK
jgi:hypothetical protein